MKKKESGDNSGLDLRWDFFFPLLKVCPPGSETCFHSTAGVAGLADTCELCGSQSENVPSAPHGGCSSKIRCRQRTAHQSFFLLLNL